MLDRARLPDPKEYYYGQFDKLKRHGNKFWTNCCFHDDKNPSLSLNLDTGYFDCRGCGESGDLIAFHMRRYGLDFKAAIEDLGADTPTTTSPVVNTTQKQQPQPDERKWQKLQAVWSETISANHPEARPLQLYLDNRGLEAIKDIPACLRFHRALPYWTQDANDKPVLVGSYPAMIAKVVNPAGKPVCLHRTYLDDKGRKANIPSPKKLMSPSQPGETQGAAIRLFEPVDTLCVSEGIETSLAIHIATGLPVWATVTAGGMCSLVVPDTVRKVFIMGDLDKSGTGELSARELAKRLMMQCKDVRIVIPKGPLPDNTKSIDWLDVLNEQGIRI